MTIICKRYTEMVDSQVPSSWTSGYYTPGTPLHFVGICLNRSETKSVSAIVPPENDLDPYECLRSSGGLAFWDRTEEDIYSFSDGEPT